MDNLKYAASFNGKLSQAAINTFADITMSIEARSHMSPWDTANKHMRAALIEAKNQSKGRKEFLVKAKETTGIAKNSHPLLMWCVANWY